jgi:four helix bundle protein
VDKPLRVLEAARAIVDEVNDLLDARGSRLIYRDQLRESAGSITANIREGSGRKPGGDRNQFLRFARASCEETDERLHANFRKSRLPEERFWPIHNRLAVVVKMLNRMMT